MNILLTGASGFLGANLAMIMRSRGHVVRPVSRRHGVDMRALLSPADWLLHLRDIDAVVNAAGIIGSRGPQDFDRLHTRSPVALFRACEQAGVRRVIQISALGADAAAVSDFQLSKRAADEVLPGLDVQGCVVRPSLVYGRGGRSAAMFLRLSALPWIPVVDEGLQLLQPVHVSDVVATVMQALAVPQVPRAIDVVGPRTLTYADWMQVLRAAQGMPRGRLMSVPCRLAELACRLLQRLTPLASPDNLRMLCAVRPADARAVEEFLGRPLLVPHPCLQFEDASVLWRSQ